MYIIRTHAFKKDFKRLNIRKQEKVEKTLILFQENSTHPQLKNHKLKGGMCELYSMSVDYDLRIIFRYEEDRIVVILLSVGTHEQVYL